ncbi:AAA family ATPase [Campylobacter subantarcticus]|uniref:ATPase, AAA family n=1 Tax=Campylobacter subantarcticus LMG 24374 TaxID=1388751 RepID=A0A0A8HC82_9BACT|nr:AAA domain protein [Campylobacter subantarcticus]AJC91577.1 ATPase, AAA family [Campylobacter subantarcticus LMG 24374]EAJ1260913.1 AAA domain protein [Campylobacter lari]
MYLEKIIIKNISAIKKLEFTASFTEDGSPKPIVIVGENGSGKTTLLSNIIDSFYEISSNLFSNVAKMENTSRKFYKINGVPNLSFGENKGFVFIKYKSKNIEELIEYIDYINCNTDDIKEFCSLNLEAKSSKKTTYFNKDYIEILRQEWHTQAHYYQPANRYEEPFWKNPNFDDSFKETKKYINKYNKELEIITSLEKNYSYILDIVLDGLLYKSNKDSLLWNEINKILQEIKQDKALTFGIGPRHSNNRIGIYKDKKLFLNNINQLSLGELTLLNLFVNIIRHTDLSNETMDKFEGIVVIDEIDVHLHSDLQSKVLPSLIKLFPKIQFIITTHSPLFVLGMQREFEDDGFDLLEMPSGIRISAERFSEFQKAYDTFRQTETFEKDIDNRIKSIQKPTIFVEGKTDVKYIKKAIEIFNRNDLDKKIEIEQIGFEDENGAKNSNDKALFNAEKFLEANQKFLNNKVLILHDPENKVQERWIGEKLRINKMPFFEENFLNKGIENLFSKETIDKIKKEKPQYIDFTESYIIKIRGKEKTIPDKHSVNKDEKVNLCNWICENGTEEDFENFKVILEIIDEFLEKKD